MATTKGIAKMSKVFDQAYNRPIDEEAYSLWMELFVDVDDVDLRKAAVSLVKNRSQYTRGQVTPDEMTRELRYIGDFRQEDPAFVAAMGKRFPVAQGEGITLAEFRKTDEEGAQAIEGYTDLVDRIVQGGNDEGQR